MDDDEKSEFYGEFGGVYLGPPNSKPKPSTQTTPDLLTPTRPLDVAQVHHSFDDEVSFFDMGPSIEVDLPSTQHLKNEFEMKNLGGGNELSVPVPVFNNGSLLD